MRLTEAWARTGRKKPGYTPGLKKNTTGKRLASQIVKEFSRRQKLFERGLFFSPVGPPKLS